MHSTDRHKIKQAVSDRNLKGPVKQVGIKQIGQFVEEGDLEGAEMEAENWVDRHAVKRQLNAQLPTFGKDHNSFDAEGIIKRKTDEKDPYYIFKNGNKNLDGGCDFVFKSGKVEAEMASAMDQDGPENILQLKNAYLDATHTRVYGFKTFGLWLVHPAMKQIIRLVSIKLKSENHVEIANSVTLFNKMCSEVKGVEGYKLNPRYFVCDEVCANYKAVRHIYGQEYTECRDRGCQWHFKLSVCAEG